MFLHPDADTVADADDEGATTVPKCFLWKKAELKKNVHWKTNNWWIFSVNNLGELYNAQFKDMETISK